MPDPINPNRLAGSPALGEPALGLQPVAVVERSPTGAALIPQVLLKFATVLVLVAGVVLSLPTMGIGLPPIVLTISGLIVALGTSLGIASQGVRMAPGTQPVTLASPSAPPTPSAPRMGPPVG